MLFQVSMKGKQKAQDSRQGTVVFDIGAFTSALKDYTGPNPPGAVISFDLMRDCIGWVMDPANSKKAGSGYYEIDRKKFGFEGAAKGTLRALVGEENWEKVKILAETGIKWGREKQDEEQRRKSAPDRKPQKEKGPERSTLNDGIKIVESDFYTKTGGGKTA